MVSGADGLAAYLLDTPSGQLASELGGEVPPALTLLVAEWQRRFSDYLAEYGHSIYDLDFAKPLPVDDPLPMLEAFKMFIRGEGRDPHARQRESLARREGGGREGDEPGEGAQTRLFRWSLRWAQTFAWCVRTASLTSAWAILCCARCCASWVAA